MHSQVKPQRLLSTPNVVSLRVQLMAAEHKDRVGRRIKKAREERRWSQRELAERLPGKVDGPSVSRWERGITYPEQYLQHLAQVFEVDVSYFLI